MLALDIECRDPSAVHKSAGPIFPLARKQLFLQNLLQVYVALKMVDHTRLLLLCSRVPPPGPVEAEAPCQRNWPFEGCMAGVATSRTM